MAYTTARRVVHTRVSNGKSAYQRVKTPEAKNFNFEIAEVVRYKFCQKNGRRLRQIPPADFFALVASFEKDESNTAAETAIIEQRKPKNIQS